MIACGCVRCPQVRCSRSRCWKDHRSVPGGPVTVEGSSRYDCHATADYRRIGDSSLEWAATSSSSLSVAFFAMATSTRGRPPRRKATRCRHRDHPVLIIHTWNTSDGPWSPRKRNLGYDRIRVFWAAGLTDGCWAKAGKLGMAYSQPNAQSVRVRPSSARMVAGMRHRSQIRIK